MNYIDCHNPYFSGISLAISFNFQPSALRAVVTILILVESPLQQHEDEQRYEYKLSHNPYFSGISLAIINAVSSRYGFEGSQSLFQWNLPCNLLHLYSSSTYGIVTILILVESPLQLVCSIFNEHTNIVTILILVESPLQLKYLAKKEIKVDVTILILVESPLQYQGCILCLK